MSSLELLLLIIQSARNYCRSVTALGPPINSRYSDIVIFPALPSILRGKERAQDCSWSWKPAFLIFTFSLYVAL